MDTQRFKPGDVLADEYRVERVLGTGGFAVVYLAVQEGLGRKVAAKVLSPEEGLKTTPSTRAVERFQREARLVSKLENPHTVTLYDYGRLEDGRCYMVMEYVDGETLSEIVARTGAVEAERLVRVWQQVLDSLREAHAAGIIHRDIKPDNVMLFDRVGRTDAVKLLDFGVAKSVANEYRNDCGLTAEGAVIGTPKYMSPEQLLGRPVTPASDLFSVGILGHYLYAGDVPYDSVSPQGILQRMKQFDRDVGTMERAPEPIPTVARRLLAPRPRNRYQSAEEVIDALEGGLSAGDTTREAGGSPRAASFPMSSDAGALGGGRELSTRPSESASNEGAGDSETRPLSDEGYSTDALQSEEETKSTTAEVREDRESSSSKHVSGIWPTLVGVGGIALVAAVGWWGFERFGGDGPELSSRSGTAPEPRASTEKLERRSGPSPSGSRLRRAIDSARDGVRRAVTSASREARRFESQNRKAEESVGEREEAEISDQESGSGSNPSSASGGSASARSTGASGSSRSGPSNRGDDRRLNSDSRTDSPSVQPFDEKSDQEGSGESGSSENENLNVEAWE